MPENISGGYSFKLAIPLSKVSKTRCSLRAAARTGGSAAPAKPSSKTASASCPSPRRSSPGSGGQVFVQFEFHLPRIGTSRSS
jgi:hypothetical protein